MSDSEEEEEEPNNEYSSISLSVLGEPNNKRSEEVKDESIIEGTLELEV